MSLTLDYLSVTPKTAADESCAYCVEDDGARFPCFLDEGHSGPHLVDADVVSMYVRHLHRERERIAELERELAKERELRRRWGCPRCHGVDLGGRTVAQRVVELERERDEARRLCEQMQDALRRTTAWGTSDSYSLVTEPLPWEEKGDG